MNPKLTEQEEKAVKQLKTKVGLVLAAQYDDHHFLRWVREYKCNLMQAEAAFRQVQDFRKRVGADGEFDTYNPPQVLKKYYAGGILGHDKEGAVVKLELLGKLDMKGLMRSTRRTDLERWKSFEYDKMDRMLDEYARKVGKPVDGVTTIIDMEGAGSEWLWRPGLNTYLSLANLLQEHYPGIVKKLIVVNAPSIFPLLWKIAKGFLREDLRRIVEVYGADHKERLKKEIDEAVLPAYLGGKLKDPDDRCSATVCQGGRVPESFYMSVDGDELDHMSVAHVAHGEKLRLQFAVKDPGAILSWQFKTDDNDIGFGVEYRPTEDSDDIEDIVSLGRHESHLQIQDGSVIGKKTGIYEVIFDNTYSWSRGKRLYYHVELHVSDDSTVSEVDGFVPGAGTWASVPKADKKK